MLKQTVVCLKDPDIVIAFIQQVFTSVTKHYRSVFKNHNLDT